MAIAVRGTPTSGNGGSVAVTTQTCTVPTGTVDGDVLVLAVVGNVATTPSTPAGWTLMKATNTTALFYGVFYRVASSEPASYSVTVPSARGSWGMVAFSGVDNVTPMDVAIPAAAAGTTANAFPAITPVTAGAWVLGVLGFTQTGTAATTPTSSGLTVDATFASTATGSSVNASGAIGHALWTSGAFTPDFSEGTTTRTMSDTFALRPAAAAAAVFPTSPARRITRPAGLLRRRGRVEVPPTQVVVTSPPAKVADRRRATRFGLTSRRKRAAEVVSTQVVVAQPMSPIRALRRPLLFRRRSAAARVGFPKTASLIEDFSAALDGAKWTTFGSPVVTGGQLQLTPPPGLVTPQVVETVPLYDLTTSSMTAEFVQALNSSALNSVALFGFSPQHDTQIGGSPGQQTNWVYTFWYQSKLWFALRTNLVDDLSAGLTYDPVAHRFLRIRELSGIIYWDTSPDCYTWTNQRSLASTWDLSAGYVGLEAYNFATDTTAGTAIFDNVNLAPAVPVLFSSPTRRAVRPPQARRRSRVEMPPAQIVAAAPSYRSDPRRAARRFVLLPRRDRSVEIVPPQAAPPPETTRRRVRGFVTRRRSRVEVTPPQIVVTPPAYAPDTRRRLTRGFASRRRRAVEVVPPQIVVAPPVYAPDTRRRLTRGFASRRRRSVEVTPPQIVVAPPVYAPDTRRRIARGFASRRRKSVEVVPPQIFVTPPVYKHETRRRVRGFVVSRRDRSVEVIPPQAVPPPEIRRRASRFVARRRSRRVEVTPPQVVVTPPVYVPSVPAKRSLRGLVRRGRHVVPVPPQQTAPAPRYVPAVPRRRAIRGVPRRGRRADVPQAQAPAPRVQGRRPLRGLFRKIRRAVNVFGVAAPTAPLVPQVILTAEIYPRVLTAGLDEGDSLDGPATHTLTAEVYPRTLTADIT